MCPPEGADVAAVGRGRAAEPAARLQQRGGGEGAVPHARGQSTGRVWNFHHHSFIPFFFTGIQEKETHKVLLFLQGNKVL